jgi:hypothetical protein
MAGGMKQALTKNPKRRSAAQQTHIASLAAQRANKENIPQPMEVPKPAPRKTKDYKKEFANSQRKVHHMRQKDIKLQTKISDLAMQLKAEKKEREICARKLAIASKRTADLAAERERQLVVLHQSILNSQKVVVNVRKENRALAKRVHRASGVLQRTIARMKERPVVSRLTKKGMYTIQAHQMARIMVGAGCARAKVGPLMMKIGSILGVKIQGGRMMSERTVGRAVLEGGIAARMQLTHELSLNEGAY